MVLGEMMRAGNAQKSENVMGVLLKMKKLDIKKLKEAYER